MTLFRRSGLGYLGPKYTEQDQPYLPRSLLLLAH